MYFTKPETALKQAKDLQEVGRPQLALDTLYDLITSRKHRSWSRVHEEIMFLFIQLSLELMDSQMIKDALHQFKNICQQVAIQSLEKVVRNYIKTAEAKVKNAKGLTGKVVLDIDDLEEVETPESVMLAAVSEEEARDRSDRDKLTPCLKYLWDAYRTVLDILRNNTKLERMYKETTTSAFQFCITFDRKKEFRNLCDTLRKHYQMIGKYANQVNPINLNNPESLQIHIEVRLSQMSASSNMELWQEAFKGAEDIAQLLASSKKQLHPQLLSQYFEHLAQVFWKSNEFIFHAAIWQQLFQLYKEHKKTFTAEEKQRVASEVLLSALAVPIVIQNEENAEVIEAAAERARYLADLARIPSVPTREDILRDMKALNVLQFVNPELKDVFLWLEDEFHPLVLCERITRIFVWLKPQEKLSRYIEPVRNVTMMRTLKQLSQIYQSIKISRIVELVRFSSEFEIERFIAQAVKDRIIQARLSHRDRAIYFGTNTFSLQTEAIGEGPQLQSLQSQMVRHQLSTMSQRLAVATEMISPDTSDTVRDRHRKAVFDNIRSRMEKERQKPFDRKLAIEQRKEYLEKQALISAVARQVEAIKERDERAVKESIRLADEAKRREEQRKVKEEQDMRKLQALSKLEEQRLSSNSSYAKLKQEDLANMDADAINQKREEQEDKEAKEHTTKSRALEKKIDFDERAKRVEETKILQTVKKQSEDAQREAWLLRSRSREEAQREEHARRLTLKKKLIQVQPQFNSFVQRIQASRLAEFTKAKAEYDAVIEKQNKAAKEAAEKAERERQEKERQEEERAEASRKEAEERRLKIEAEREAKRAEELEKKRKLDELAEKQREREREIEEKHKASAVARPMDPTPGGAWRRNDDRPQGDGPSRTEGNTRPEGTGYRPPQARTQAPAATSEPYRPPRTFDRPSDPPARQEERPWRRNEDRPQGDGPSRSEGNTRPEGTGYRPPQARTQAPAAASEPYRPPPRTFDRPSDPPARQEEGSWRRNEDRPQGQEGGYRPPQARTDRPSDGPPPSSGAYRPPGRRGDDQRK